MADAKILLQLVDKPWIAAQIADDVAVVKQIGSVSQLVTRRLQSERRYLARLEGKLSGTPNPYAFLQLVLFTHCLQPLQTRFMPSVSSLSLQPARLQGASSWNPLPT